MNVKADMCACCKEIWNHNNLDSVNLGKHKLYLCLIAIKNIWRL